MIRILTAQRDMQEDSAFDLRMAVKELKQKGKSNGRKDCKHQSSDVGCDRHWLRNGRDGDGSSALAKLSSFTFGMFFHVCVKRVRQMRLAMNTVSPLENGIAPSDY